MSTRPDPYSSTPYPTRTRPAGTGRVRVNPRVRVYPQTPNFNPQPELAGTSFIDRMGMKAFVDLSKWRFEPGSLDSESDTVPTEPLRSQPPRPQSSVRWVWNGVDFKFLLKRNKLYFISDTDKNKAKEQWWVIVHSQVTPKILIYVVMFLFSQESTSTLESSPQSWRVLYQ
jgi:hypothetical protein